MAKRLAEAWAVSFSEGLCLFFQGFCSVCSSQVMLMFDFTERLCLVVLCQIFPGSATPSVNLWCLQVVRLCSCCVDLLSGQSLVTACNNRVLASCWSPQMVSQSGKIVESGSASSEIGWNIFGCLDVSLLSPCLLPSQLSCSAGSLAGGTECSEGHRPLLLQRGHHRRQGRGAFGSSKRAGRFGGAEKV